MNFLLFLPRKSCYFAAVLPRRILLLLSEISAVLNHK
ncbi:hypothetical protein SLEP1_g56666 [Rubroshorea leprosula]|uniref:Uncharacterized protein n=1 Tax=Rubroshorea leprosula TaxID=152421 RepID=A0AAV5MJ61_9ROSI|nr:hypothetical protein SLEP1_g56666 [Rubroshorea leprosula]